MVTAKEIKKDLFDVNKLLTEIIDIDQHKIESASNDLNTVKLLGFKNIKNTDPLKEYENTVEQSEQIKELRDKYPLIKFITKNALLQICKKYNLIIGWPEIFTAEIPAKNVKELSEFSMKEEDLEQFDKNQVSFKAVGKWKKSSWRIEGNVQIVYKNLGIKSIPMRFRPENGVNREIEIIQNLYSFDKDCWNEEWINLFNKIDNILQNRKNTLVVATSKHFNMKGMSINSDHFIEESTEPFTLEVMTQDPIVIKNTKYDNIFAIASAWGEESYDPLLINEIYN